MAVEGLSRMESLQKTDRSKLKEFPVFSPKERDRRWGLMRRMMEEKGVGALMVLPGGDFDCPSVYLSNHNHFLLFFPLQGEPVAFWDKVDWLPALLEDEAYGIEGWIKWQYARSNAEGWIKVLRERGMTNARIGTVARSHFSGREQQKMADGLTRSIQNELSGVTFVDLYDPYFEIFTIKGEEEIAMLRKAALASEVACEEYLNACRPGNNVANVQIAALSAAIPNGVLLRCDVGSGPDGGRGVNWLGAGLAPPVLKKGDLVYSELFAWVGPVHVQSQLCVSIGEPSGQKKKLAALAREAYEIGVETIRPGIAFGEVAKAMNQPNMRGGAWKWMPNVHTLNPLEAVDIHPEGMLGPAGLTHLKERIGDVGEEVISGAGGRSRRWELVLQEGWTLELEAHSCFGPTYVQVGGTVLVTKHGCEELNKIPTRMIVVPA